MINMPYCIPGGLKTFFCELRLYLILSLSIALAQNFLTSSILFCIPFYSFLVIVYHAFSRIQFECFFLSVSSSPFTLCRASTILTIFFFWGPKNTVFNKKDCFNQSFWKNSLKWKSQIQIFVRTSLHFALSLMLANLSPLVGPMFTIADGIPSSDARRMNR